MRLTELDPDQRREIVNTQQRFDALRDVERRALAYRGSMTWSATNGTDYLLRSTYGRDGRRRQRSLGRRSSETEALKAEFDAARAKIDEHRKGLKAAMARQASVNRALRLGRMPVDSARILRALDHAGLLGGKLKVLGSNALYAYEAVSGVRLDADLLETGDFDFLLDARARLSLVDEGVEPNLSLLTILQSVDRSFMRSAQTFRAVNRDGFMVDLVTALRDPPWAGDPQQLGSNTDDLVAVEIDGLAWHESAPPFEAIVIDTRGEPARIITTDPRVFAAHKLWLSGRADREPVKRARDALQAQAVCALLARYLLHLPFDRAALRMLPQEVFDAATKVFGVMGA